MTAANPAGTSGGGDVESAKQQPRFRLLPADRSPDEIERGLLEVWKSEGLFRQTVERASPRGEFVFFEGPPTANGRPGIHHVFSRTVKDLFCRHRAMQGYHVTRKAGWDTHGLPVEIEVEKQLAGELGLSGKQQIERIGVEKFNAMCRESVWKYRADWQELSERIAYWLDYSDPYVTYSNDYMESVWWALATLFEKSLLYRGHKILPYCPRCETTLSSHEVAQGYKDVKDPSAYVALELAGPDAAAAQHRRRILVWTTTPWTLVSNVALAVNPELEYSELRRRAKPDGAKPGPDDPDTIILAAARASAVLGEDYETRWEKVASIRGSELAGKRYRRPLDWIAFDGKGEHEIIVAEDFVSAEDGTGVVHIAPAFGADDYAAGKRNGLAFLQPVDSRGEFVAGTPLVAGKFVKDADATILEELKRLGVLWKTSLFEHSYPHCWRCDTPLLYYARTSWFIRTTQFKDAMLERNSRMDWHPPEMRDGRFGEWLTNNIDWAVSRDRYWGTPLPIWVCDRDSSHAEAVGSYEQLARRSGATIGEGFDPHKPFIDRMSWRCSQCDGTMTRTPEVIDAWFDSGSMSFAQWHFPFENREKMAAHFPADFIAEGVDQTRGWFYSLLAIATGLGDALPNNSLGGEARAGARSRADGGIPTAPYRSIVVNDLVLDAEGQKMSKRLGNIVDPTDVIPRHGADAIRLSLISSSQLWTPRRFDEAVIRDTAGRFLLTLKNVYNGIFAEYANFGWAPGEADPAPAERPLLDRWVLSRLAGTELEANRLLDEYDATSAVKRVMTFFDEDVSKWYVRLSRHRFYDVDGEDNRSAFATLHEVLTVTCRLLAPFAPFVTDWIHRELTGGSVHLAPYARGDASGSASPALESAMASLRKLATLGRAAREEAGVKVRQPLSRIVCVVPGEAGQREATPEGAGGGAAESVAALLDELKPLLAAELNVKRVEFAPSGDDLVNLEAKPNFRALGKRFGKSTPLAAKAVEALKNESLRAFETGAPLYLSVEGETHELLPDEITLVRRASGDLTVEEDGGYFAAIDPSVSEELASEGLARELVSRVQKLRKELGFAVSDRIRLVVYGSPEVGSAVDRHRKWIADEVLALQLDTGEPEAEKNETQSLDLEGRPVQVTIERIG